MEQLVLIIHNLRSTHNVGSLLRTSEGLGVSRLFLTGYSPYPLQTMDSRLPHIARKLDAQIHKTALGAEKLVDWQHQEDIFAVLEALRAEKFMIVALEQTKSAIQLPDFAPPDKLALIVGREVEGIEKTVLAVSDAALEVPMFGKKESFNVVQATAMALYHCRFRLHL